MDVQRACAGEAARAGHTQTQARAHELLAGHGALHGRGVHAHERAEAVAATAHLEAARGAGRAVRRTLADVGVRGDREPDVGGELVALLCGRIGVGRLRVQVLLGAAGGEQSAGDEQSAKAERSNHESPRGARRARGRRLSLKRASKPMGLIGI